MDSHIFSRDGNDDLSYSNHPMYSSYVHNYTLPITSLFNDFEDDLESTLNDHLLIVIDWTLMGVNAISLALDGYSVCALVGGAATLNPVLVSSGVGTKGLSLTARYFTRIARIFIRQNSMQHEISYVKQLSRTFTRKNAYTLDELSKTGQILDKNGLTKAGRSLDKHGGRQNSVFPKATGDIASKNAQGQHHLDDILTSPRTSTHPNRFGGADITTLDGRGARFDNNFNFMGFLQSRII